ncbi:hypothetical protein BH09MYX1_BH09MYX1_09530 [soil metagenome]
MTRLRRARPRLRVALGLVAALWMLKAAGCRTQITARLENHGALISFQLECGDCANGTMVPGGGSASFAPSTNACTLTLEPPATGRNFDLDFACKSSSCSFSVVFPPSSGAPSATPATERSTW